MTPKQQVEHLMNQGLPLAQRMLSEYGEFYPYAVVLTSQGQVTQVGASDGTEHPSSQDLLGLLFTAMHQGAAKGEYRAVAVFADVRVQKAGETTKTDAIRVSLEHRDNYCVNVYLPYTKTDAGVAYGEIFAEARVCSAFTSP